MNPGKFHREAVETFPSAWMRTSDTLRAFAQSQITDYYSGSALLVAVRRGGGEGDVTIYIYICIYLRGLEDMRIGLRNVRLLRKTFNMLYSAIGFIIHVSKYLVLAQSSSRDLIDY